MMKKNWGRILWVSVLFLLLIVILLTISIYKIYFQYKTDNYLYFYECKDNLCVSEVQEDEHLMYSKYNCKQEACPIYKSNLGDSYAILERQENHKQILFNYRTEKIITQEYKDYTPIDSTHFIITKGNKQGIMENNGSLVVPIIYDKIGYYQDNNLTGYNFQYIIAKINNNYGLISYQDGDIIEKFEYNEDNIKTLLEKLKEDQ